MFASTFPPCPLCGFASNIVSSYMFNVTVTLQSRLYTDRDSNFRVSMIAVFNGTNPPSLLLPTVVCLITYTRHVYTYWTTHNTCPKTISYCVWIESKSTLLFFRKKKKKVFPGAMYNYFRF